MTEQGAEGSGVITIGGRYRVRPDQQRDAFAGLFCCGVEHAATAIDQAQARVLVAVRTRREAPPPAALPHYARIYNANLLSPVAHGAGNGAYWIICDAPPRRSLLQALFPGPLAEAELVNAVLKPLAQALNRLHAAGLTHRAVRLTNLFRSDGGRILLGPGCLGPHAFDQPVLYEPTSSGLCPPSCRGAGMAADDVYALGVVSLELLLGRRLLPDMTDAQIVQRKLELGSFHLLAGDERLPPGLMPLLRSMLSDDPQARPTLASVAESGISAERPKQPRPDPRAPRPLMLGRMPIYTARMLAQAFSRQPAEALAFLRSGAVDQWLRRALEQPLIAVRIDETLRTGRDRGFEGSDPMLLMQVIAILDPLAPMFWHGVWLWPEAVPSMLASLLVEGGDTAPVVEMLQTRALRRWCLVSGRLVTAALEEVERCNARFAALPDADLKLPSLCYALNPFLRCMSAALQDACVLGPEPLLLALEARDADRPAGGRVLDLQMLALLTARAAGEEEIPLASSGREKDGLPSDLVLLAWAQRSVARAARDGPEQETAACFPRLAARLLPAARDRLKSWPGKGPRARRVERLEQVAAAGDLVSMLLIVDHTEARAADELALREACQEVQVLRGAHMASLQAGEERSRLARIGGHDLGIAAGVLGLLVVVLAELVL